MSLSYVGAADPYYAGFAKPAEGGDGYVSVVTDGATPVWTGKKVYKNKKRADRKADKIADDLNEGVIASDWCDHDPTIDC